MLKTLGEQVGAEQLAHADDRPADVEGRVRQRLGGYRQALRTRRDEMIAEEQDKQVCRDQAIRTYVQSGADSHVLSAA